MGREPSREELAKALDTTVDEIDDLTEMGRREPLSLQSPVGEDTELGDLIEEIDSEAGVRRGRGHSCSGRRSAAPWTRCSTSASVTSWRSGTGSRTGSPSVAAGDREGTRTLR